jgi:hypothetical protein
MRNLSALVLAVSLGVLTSHALAEEEQVGNQPGSGFTTVLSSGMRYAMNYEQQFALLAAEEHYVQELLRPPNPGDNLSRSNPGGGMRAGGQMNLQEIPPTTCWCNSAATARLHALPRRL